MSIELHNSITTITDLIKNNNLNLAEIKAKKICNKYSNIDLTHNLLGIIYQKKNNYLKAIKSFKKAIKINPQFISALNNLGIVYQSLKKDHEALKYFTDILIINPKLFVIQNHVALLYLKINNIEKAMNCVNNSLNENNTYINAYFTKGKIYEKMNKHDDAITVYKKGIEIDPQFSRGYFALGEIYSKQKDYNSGLANFIKSKETKAKVRELECLYLLNKIEDYEQKVKDCIKTDPNDRRIASVTSFIFNKLHLNNYYPFCPNPLKFIFKSSLKNHLTLEKLFLSNLINEIEAENFSWEPSGKTTINGYGTTGNLSEKVLPQLTEFQKIINIELSNFYNNFKDEKCNFIKEWPKKFYIDSWSNILTNQGHNISHIHPSGWISGVFYLKVPKNLQSNEGGIEFSLKGDDFLSDEKDNIPKIEMLPKEGDIVIFPSSLYHKTIPFNSNEQRMCIAFDIHKIS